ncbi:hypothetical protein GCM10023208_34520 [Erythrobacter westpacificensis]|uniref:Uncharacterized protein n=2 Tax=Erythrobacter westpacificensis TaxID=1055231 RepID=A0ABP9KTS6_9SPHN
MPLAWSLRDDTSAFIDDIARGRMCNHYKLWAEYERVMRRTPGLHEEAHGFAEGIEREQVDIWPTRPTATESVSVKYPGTVIRWDGDRQIVERMAWGIVTTIKGARGQPLKRAQRGKYARQR